MMKCLSECFAGPHNKALGRDGEEDTLIDPHPSSVFDVYHPLFSTARSRARLAAQSHLYMSD